MPHSQIGGSPDFPDVVGFELPAAEVRQARGQDQIAVVMLNVAPSREWIATFLEQAERFKVLNALTDVRIVGKHITLMGRLDDARTLTSSTKLLVQNTSQIRMRDRLSQRGGPQEPGPAAEGPPILWEEDERMREVAAVAAIPGVRHFLSEIIRLTGMRCAAIARVTDTRWTACATYDLLEFGLKPGQDLVLESTICNEIRQNPRTVAFGQASLDPVYAHHRARSLYGFESYISVPIWTADGLFFGTLCALDPRPAVLDAATIGAIEAFAHEIGSQLSGIEGTVRHV